MAKRPVVATCQHCGVEFVKTVNVQKFCPDCGKLTRKKAHVRAVDKHRKKRNAQRRQMRLEMKRQNFLDLFRGTTQEDFLSAVRGPAEKGDRLIHVKCAPIPGVFICGRSHVKGRRWMKPAPVRDITCPRCKEAWEMLYGDEPVPIVGHEDWSSDPELMKEYGLS